MTLTARDEVLQAVPEEDRLRVSGLATYIGNTSPGYRPSDAARRAVSIYEAGELEEWEAQRKAESDSLHRRECQFGPQSCKRCRGMMALEYRYEVWTGVKGAHRVRYSWTNDLEEAQKKARRHGRSNSIGSYWARIVDLTTGEKIERIN